MTALIALGVLRLASTYELLLKFGGTVSSSLGKSASNAAKSIKGIESAAKSTNAVLKTAMGALAGYVSVKGIIDFGKDVMDASNAAATAQTRLQTTMMNVKGTTQAQVDAIAQYSDALEKNTSISHTANEIGASQLATFNLHTNTIKNLLPALDNMATAQYGVNVSQGDMQKTATLLGKAMAGNTTAFTRYGIILTATQKNIFKNGTEAQKATALMEIMKNKYGDLSTKMAQTPAGRIQQLNNAWEKVKETIGEKLTPVVTQALSVIGKNLPNIESGIMGAINALTPAFNYIKDDIIPGLGTAFKVTGGVLTWFGQNMKTIGPIILGVATAVGIYKAVTLAMVAVQKTAMIIEALGKAWKTAGVFIQLLAEGEKLGAVAQLALNMAMEANPIGMITIGIIALVGAGILLYKNWDKISAGAKKLWADIQPVFSAIGSFITGVFEGVWNGIKMYINFWIGALNTLFKGINAVSGAIGKVTGVNLTIPTIPNLGSGGIVLPKPGGTLVNLAEKGQSEAVIPLGKGGGFGGGDHFTYSPQIYIQGNASKADIKSVLDDSQQEFERRMEIWQMNKDRVSFRPRTT